MTICGIDIKGSEAIFALATQGPDGLQHLATASKKIALDDDENALNVKAFAAQLAAFVKANGITRIAIKKRSKKGEFAGGCARARTVPRPESPAPARAPGQSDRASCRWTPCHLRR